MSTLIKNTANQPIPIVLKRPDKSVIGTTVGVTVTVGLDTTTLTSGAGTLSYTSGQLYYTPTQAETNGNVLIVKATHAEAAQDWVESFACVAPVLTAPANFASLAIDANGRIQIQSGTATGQLSQSAGTVAVGAFASGLANSLGDTIIGRLDANAVPGSPTAGTYAERFSRIQASGNVATTAELQAEIAALNQSASRRVMLVNIQQFERPESGSTAFEIEARTYDGDGAAVNADSTPTLTATGSTTGSLAANLGSATNPATGVYRWAYTVANNATLEQIRFDLSATIASSTFTISSYAFVCDFVAATFTTADRDNLAAILEDTGTTIPATLSTISSAASGAQTAAESANTRVLASLPNATPGTNSGLPLKSDLDDVGGAPSARDLLPVQFTWQLKPSGAGALRSTNALVIPPGTSDFRAGVNCRINALLPPGTVIQEVTEPTSSDSDHVTATLTTAGSHDGNVAKFEVTSEADAHEGDYWLTTTISNTAGDGPIPVYLKVTVEAAPE